MELNKSNICYVMTQLPVTHGCSHRSPGCINCWSEATDKRFYPCYNFGKTILRLDLLYSPFSVKTECSCFIDCNSDLFYEGEGDPDHDGVPDEFICRILEVVNLCPNIQFLILTKRYERCTGFFKEYSKEKSIPDNLHIGFSVCCNSEVKYIDYLRQIPCKCRWISFEPLLSDVAAADGFSLEGIEVAIIGGEQAPGKKARKMEKDWVLGIQEKCLESDTIFYFKQWGDWSETGKHKNTKVNGHQLDGKEYRKLPWPNNK